MGLRDLLRFGRVLLGTAQAVRHPRQSAADLRALQAPALVAASLAAVNAPAGSVLEVEGGRATRYDGFRHWLATRASLLSSL